jgi:DNA-binding transcriptional ArsR family regulator
VGVSVLEVSSLDQVAALTHPIRRNILAELAEPASPAEVARRLGLAPQLANYHVRALVEAGLAERVETRQKRNLLEHRFRAVARSFALSSALPLSDAQRSLLQQDVALQQLVQSGDAIRNEALALLDAPDSERNVAAIQLDVTLADASVRAQFVRAVVEAVHEAAKPFRGDPHPACGLDEALPEGEAKRRRFRVHLAIYPGEA